MLRFYKAGLHFLMLLLSFILIGPHLSFSQCSFTNLDPSYCFSDGSFPLTGGTNYYGPGVTGSTFDPAAAGVGSHRLVTTDGVYNVITSGSFNPQPPVAPTAVPLGDNAEQLVSIGFTFNFFGIDYTQLRIG